MSKADAPSQRVGAGGADVHGEQLAEGGCSPCHLEHMLARQVSVASSRTDMGRTFAEVINPFPPTHTA